MSGEPTRSAPVRRCAPRVPPRPDGASPAPVRALWARPPHGDAATVREGCGPMAVRPGRRSEASCRSDAGRSGYDPGELGTTLGDVLAPPQPVAARLTILEEPDDRTERRPTASGCGRWLAAIPPARPFVEPSDPERDLGEPRSVHLSGGMPARGVPPQHTCPAGALRRRDHARGAQRAEEVTACISRLRPPPPTNAPPSTHSCPFPGQIPTGRRGTTDPDAMGSECRGPTTPDALRPPPARRGLPLPARPRIRGPVGRMPSHRLPSHRPTQRVALLPARPRAPRHGPRRHRAAPPTCLPPTRR